MTAHGYLRDFGARVENRLSRYFYATPFKLANRQPIVSVSPSTILTEPSPFGCTQDLLRHALNAAAKRNIAIMTVAEALRASGL